VLVSQSGQQMGQQSAWFGCSPTGEASCVRSFVARSRQARRRSGGFIGPISRVDYRRIVIATLASPKDCSGQSGRRMALGGPMYPNGGIDLELHPDKIRLVEFSRQAATDRAERAMANRRPSTLSTA